MYVKNVLQDLKLVCLIMQIRHYLIKYILTLKGTYYGKFTFTWYLNINVCWQCVSKTTLE